jgi:putative aldouronate transport system permease protein
MAYRLSKGEKVFNVANIIALAIIGLLALYPFLYTLTMSFGTHAEAAKGGWLIIPRHLTFTSYRMVFKNPEIARGYANTIFRTLVGTLASVFATCLAAFPLSRKSMPLRGPLTFFILFTMIFSGGIVPTFLLYKSLHLYDSLLVYILPGLMTAFNIIIVKNYFQSIPDSLYESAMLDGANDWTILLKIYLPLSMPVIATIILWTAVGHWNSWFDAMLYINNDSKQVMQTFLQRIVIQSDVSMIQRGLVHPDVTKFTPETIKAATVIITILPILLLYPFVQRYFLKGIMLGSVKE